MNRHNILLSCLSIFFLASCTTKQPRRTPYVNVQAVRAESYMQSGQHKQAANIFQSLAKSKPEQQLHFSLLATEAFIQSGDSHAAQTLVNSFNIASLSATQRNKLNLLKAQINLSNGEVEQALNQLGMVQVYNLEVADQITFYQSLAFAHSLSGNLLQSAQSRIQLTPLFDSTEQINENNRVILNTLNLLPLETLSLEQPSTTDILSGWMVLTQILKTTRLNQNSTDLQTKLLEWQQLFPQHPANSDFLLSFVEGRKHSFKLPSAIALLLPKSGRFAQAAEVIKKGFMEAYHYSQSGFQPPIRFYDSSSDSAITLYHQAIAEGAELVIGPLSKNNIQTLAMSTELTIPVLALNHIPNLAKDNLFQFGLSPIDDIIQITKLASQHNLKNALLLTPKSKQGQRIADHLTDSWEFESGHILEQQSFNAKESDFSQPIKSLLNLDESKGRYNRLKRFLAKDIQYTERRRHDVEAIFLSARPQTARSLYPQLQFYRATGIPVYATSHLYSGRPNPSLDIDLNSITFCDLPWLFPEAYEGSLDQESLRSLWENIPRRYIRLLALGIDSFNMISYLGQLDTIPYSGATGTLSVNLDNRITRQLACAKFIKGKPVLQDYIPYQPEIIDDQQVIYSEDFIQ